MSNSLGTPPIKPSTHLQLDVELPASFLASVPSNCVPSILLRLPPALYPDVYALQRTAPKAVYHMLESRISNADVDWKFIDVESPVGISDPKADARRAYAETGGAEPVEAKPRRTVASIRAGSSTLRVGGDRAQAYGSIEQAEHDYNLPLAPERRVWLVQLGKAGSALNSSQTGMPLHVNSRYLPPTASPGPRPGWLDVDWAKLAKVFMDPEAGNYWNVELSPPQLFWSCRGQRSLDEEGYGDVFGE